MSIEGISYAKRMDVRNARSKLILLIIGENTYNDSGLCKVGHQVIADETGSGLRTVARHIADMKHSGILLAHAIGKKNGGRAFDALEMAGFKDWLKSKHAKMAGNGGGNMPKRRVLTRQYVAGLYKDTVQENISTSATALSGASGAYTIHGAMQKKGGSPRDTSESFEAYRARMIAEGKL